MKSGLIPGGGGVVRAKFCFLILFTLMPRSEAIRCLDLFPAKMKQHIQSKQLKKFLALHLESIYFSDFITAAKRGTTPEEWTKRFLFAHGAMETDFSPIEILFKKLSSQNYPSDLLWAQLGFELSLQKYILDHYSEINEASESLFYDRKMQIRTSNQSINARVSWMFDKLRDLETFSKLEFAAVEYSVEALFIDLPFYETTVSEALQIAHWLTGPYANIKTSAQLKKAINAIGLEFPYGYREARQTCGQNCGMGQILRRHRIYTVPYQNHNYIDHWYLIYFSAHDADSNPVIVDFSFNQFFVFKNAIKTGPFVGTEEELILTAKRNQSNLNVARNEGRSLNLTNSPYKLLSLFQGRPNRIEIRLNQMSLSQIILIIKKRLAELSKNNEED